MCLPLSPLPFFNGSINQVYFHFGLYMLHKIRNTYKRRMEENYRNPYRLLLSSPPLIETLIKNYLINSILL